MRFDIEMPKFMGGGKSTSAYSPRVIMTSVNEHLELTILITEQPFKGVVKIILNQVNFVVLEPYMWVSPSAQIFVGFGKVFS